MKRLLELTTISKPILFIATFIVAHVSFGQTQDITISGRGLYRGETVTVSIPTYQDPSVDDDFSAKPGNIIKLYANNLEVASHTMVDDETRASVNWTIPSNSPASVTLEAREGAAVYGSSTITVSSHSITNAQVASTSAILGTQLNITFSSTKGTNGYTLELYKSNGDFVSEITDNGTKNFIWGIPNDGTIATGGAFKIKVSKDGLSDESGLFSIGYPPLKAPVGATTWYRGNCEQDIDWLLNDLDDDLTEGDPDVTWDIYLNGLLEIDGYTGTQSGDYKTSLSVPFNSNLDGVVTLRVEGSNGRIYENTEITIEAAGDPAFTITSGQDFYAWDSELITWNAPDELCNNGSWNLYAIQGGTSTEIATGITDEFYTWDKIHELAAGTYTLRVQHTNDAEVKDDIVFTVIEYRSLMEPTGTPTWYVGGCAVTIKWELNSPNDDSRANGDPSIKWDIYVDNLKVKNDFYDDQAGDYVYDEYVIPIQSNMSGEYTVRVVEDVASGQGREYRGTVTIQQPTSPTLSMTNGPIYYKGDEDGFDHGDGHYGTETISWTLPNLCSTTEWDLYVKKVGDATFNQEIVSNRTGDFYTWNDILNLEPGSYELWIENAYQSNLNDHVNFSINAHRSLTAPLSGANWRKGGEYQVSWPGDGEVATIMLLNGSTQVGTPKTIPNGNTNSTFLQISDLEMSTGTYKVNVNQSGKSYQVESINISNPVNPINISAIAEQKYQGTGTTSYSRVKWNTQSLKHADQDFSVQVFKDNNDNDEYDAGEELVLDHNNIDHVSLKEDDYLSNRMAFDEDSPLGTYKAKVTIGPYSTSTTFEFVETAVTSSDVARAGEVYDFEWLDGSEPGENYDVEITNAQGTVVLSETVNVNSGSWSVPINATIGSGYDLVVTSTGYYAAMRNLSVVAPTNAVTINRDMDPTYDLGSGPILTWTSSLAPESGTTFRIEKCEDGSCETVESLISITTRSYPYTQTEIGNDVTLKVIVNNSNYNDESESFDVIDPMVHRLTPPNASTVWVRNANGPIVWPDVHGASDVFNVYQVPSGGTKTLIESNVAGLSTDWTPDLTAGSYKVRVEEVNGLYNYESDDFPIFNATIAITHSFEGRNKTRYRPGNQLNIEWTGLLSGFESVVSIKRDGVEIEEIIVPIGTTSTSWLIPSSGVNYTGPIYTIDVTQTDANIVGTITGSASAFSIFPILDLEDPLPDDPDNWITFGETVPFTWSGGNPNADYQITIEDYQGEVQITEAVSGQSYNFAPLRSIIREGNYRFVVAQEDEEDDLEEFKLKVVDPQDLEQPYYWEIVTHGDQRTITWPAATVAGNYDVILVHPVDDGQNVILYPDVSTQVVDWIVANEELGLGYQIQLLRVDGLENYISSVFEISEPFDLLNPNEEAIYNFGERMNISRSGGSNSRPVVFELWESDGTNSYTFNREIGAQNTEVLSWVIPDPVDETGQSNQLMEGKHYKIKIKQVSYHDGISSHFITDMSDENFIVEYCNNTDGDSDDEHNFVTSYTARISKKGCLQEADRSAVITETSYVDGLGRVIQNVTKQGSFDYKDMVQPVVYDDFGRMIINMLPMVATTNNGDFLENAVDNPATPNDPLDGLQRTFYETLFTGEGDHAYSEQLLEVGPIGRVEKTAAPGEVWSKDNGTHLVEYAYRYNTAGEVKRLEWNGGTNTISHSDYAANKLNVTSVRDENNGSNEGETLEYTDPEGHVILKATKVVDASGPTNDKYAKTYYVYDDHGNLRHVIQPEGIRLIEEDASYSWDKINEEAFRNNWMFSYEYDDRLRMISKKVPGAEKVRMVYDQLDRLVLTQDGNQRNYEEVSVDKSVDEYTAKHYHITTGSLKLQPGFKFTASASQKFLAVKDINKIPQDWSYTKYDELNRPVITGQISLQGSNASINSLVYDHYVDTSAPKEPEDIVWGESLIGEMDDDFSGYSNVTFPDATLLGDDSRLLTVTYYDDYSFESGTFHGYVAVDFDETPYNSYESQVLGQVAGSRTKEMSDNTWIDQRSFYDEYYRVARSESYVNLGGDVFKDRLENEYASDVLGLITSSVRYHTGPDGTIDINDKMEYDHLNRLTTVKQVLDDGPDVTLSKSTYNSLNQLSQKLLGVDVNLSDGAAQVVDYGYNIRGWLTQINNGTSFDHTTDKFGMSLAYNTGNQYNGNIGQVTWKAMDQGDAAGEAQSYNYSYDPMSRLTGATYSNSNNTSWNNFFNVSGLQYDYNGNIELLTRKSHVDGVIYDMDKLDYDYINGNQLLSVDDDGSSTAHTDGANDEITQLRDYGFFDGSSAYEEYTYDANGNMISDLNKGISSITYNYLNLPEKVVQGETEITYTYDASGMKLRKEVNNGGSIVVNDYIGGIHYTNNEISFFQHVEGRAVKSGDDYDYNYNLTDHLGNVRVSVDANGGVVQKDDYYPFGMAFNNSATSPENRYKYNGKEEQQETQWVDYGLRMYDPAIGRWNHIDPLAGNYLSYSPYSYALNNPVLYIDPDGAAVEDPVKNLIVLVGGGYDLNQIVGDLLNNGNENWTVKMADDFEGAASAVDEATNGGEDKLDNLVIASHGFSGGINADGKGVKSKDVAAHNGGMSEGDQFYGQSSNWMYGSDHKMSKGKHSKISAMKSMASNVSEGGNVIFTACLACSNENGQELGSNLVQAFDGRVNVFLNGDYSKFNKPGASFKTTVQKQTDQWGRVHGTKVVKVPIGIIGGSMTYGSVQKGWTRFGRDGSINNVGQLNLNLKGSPVTY